MRSIMDHGGLLLALITVSMVVFALVGYALPTAVEILAWALGMLP